MKKIIRLTEGDLHRIIENSVKRILKENYPPGAANDPRAPYNQVDFDDSVVYERIDEEIDTLSEEFAEWFFENHEWDETMDEEEILQQASQDQEVRDEYTKYRYDAVYEEEVSYDDEPDYDPYDEWRDRQLD